MSAYLFLLTRSFSPTSSLSSSILLLSAFFSPTLFLIHLFLTNLDITIKYVFIGWPRRHCAYVNDRVYVEHHESHPAFIRRCIDIW